MATRSGGLFNTAVWDGWLTVIAFIVAAAVTGKSEFYGAAGFFFIYMQLIRLEQRVDRLWDQFNDERLKRIAADTRRMSS